LTDAHVAHKVNLCGDAILDAPVAQLDRASDFGSEGCRFKSCPAHH
jgi:hypothetical protein